MESSPQSSASSDVDVHVCVICGDTATAYKFYGASSVCYSCRIFFRRVVSSTQKLTCSSTDKTSKCAINKVTRSHCKKCRYDKCLLVGLLPYLVNSTNRNLVNAANSKVKGKKKETTYPVRRLENQDSASVINLNIEKPYQLELDDSSFKKYSLNILMQSITNVFFNDFLEQLMEIEEALISQIREKRPIIKVQTNIIDVSNNFFISSMNEANKTFFPNFSKKDLEALSESATRTLNGFALCITDYFPATNLFQQTKNCAPLYSDKIMSTYKERFPDMESLKPVPYENYDLWVSPYAKCHEDETFMENTIRKFQEYLCQDDVLCELILLLAIFSPVNVDLREDQLKLIKHYQQKVSIMIYSHLMARRNHDNLTSLDTVTKIVTCIADLNKMGFIMQYGLLKNSHGENEECLNIDSIDIDFLEEEIK